MGKSKPKIEVDLYYMSIHFGICAEADAMKRIVIKEKEAWSGYATIQTSFVINKPDLFGGNKKEGGAAGTVYWLPGVATQVLPDILATRLGRANGADAPGYRGLASAWFTGGTAGGGASGTGGLEGLFEHLLKVGSNSKGGFYWSANQPYLPGTWIQVERAPKGLDASIALILRPGSDEFPFTTVPGAGHGISLTAPEAGFLYQGGTNLRVWDLTTFTQSSVTLPVPIVSGAHANDSFGAGGGKIWAIGNSLFAPQLWSFDLDGTNGALVIDTHDGLGNPNWDGAAGAATYKGGLVCFYTATQNEAYQMVAGSGRVNKYLCGFRPCHYFTDADDPGKTWCVGNDGTTADNLWVSPVPALATGTMIGSTDGECYAMDNGAGQFLIWQNNLLMLVDKVTLAIVDTTPYVSASDFVGPSFDAVVPGAASIWLGFANQISTRTLQTLRTVDLNDWFTEGSFSRSIIYNPIRNALITNIAADETMSERLLDRGERDANPAHIVYECLTNTDWGMGSPSTLIDVDSFTDAAQTLYDEPLGLSMIWTRQASIQDFIQEVLDHIQAVLFVDPQTGLLTLKLIRGDYDPDDLSTIDESTAELTNFGRKLWGEIVNEITVTWTNPENEQDETVTVHDLASITTQGGIVSDSRNYYGVRSATVAARLAARDLRSSGAPLATCEAEVDRTQWALRPASVVKLDWPEYGLEGLVMRVTSIDYGKPGDPALKLSLIEDVFGLDAGAYVEPPTSSWEDPSAAPTPLEHEAVFTMPLFFAANSTVAAFVETPEYPEVIAGVLGTTSDSDTFSWELWDELTLPDGTPEWTNLQTNSLAGYAELVNALDAEVSTTFETTDFANVMGQTSPANGGFMLIGDGTEETSEIALITAVGTDFTVQRGVLDTIPRAWAAGTPCWFLDASSLFEDPQVRSAGETVSYKFLTRTSQGLLPLSSAPLIEETLSDRPWLPNRPANVEIDGVMFNTAATPVDMTAASDVPVSWANRNRLTEDSLVFSWADATTAPEDGQTTTIRVMTPDDLTLLGEDSGLTGTSYNVPLASFGGEAIGLVKFYASRTDADGDFDSLQAHGIYVQVGPVRTTEEGDARVTEEGDARVME